MDTAKPFRLYMTPTSPFARKCRIVVRERGLTDRVEDFDARVRTDENEVLAVSPLGKVPTLAGPDGLILVDSTVICEFLDCLDGTPALHGADRDARFRMSGDWALAEALMESLAWLAREFRRPPEERSPSFIAYESARQRRVYDFLDATPPDPNRRDISQITLAIALDYGLYRFPDADWRPGRPRLVEWFENEAARAAFVQTALPPKP